jgi:DDE superfamily endonuclease
MIKKMESSPTRTVGLAPLFLLLIKLMLSLPKEINEVFTPFKVLFVQQRSWHKAQLMLVGALLCRGQRTVSQVLRVMGLEQERQYGKYYRMLSRVGWSGLAAAQILLGLIVALLGSGETVVIGIDETLERRWGKQIWGLGIYRDGVKSSLKHTAKSTGVRWQVMQVLLKLPWSHRVWGLPFFTLIVPSQAAAQQSHRPSRSSLDWAICMVRVVNRWLKRHWVCVADGAYGNAKFGWACRVQGVSLVARLPWKANLYDFAPTMPPRYRGRRRTKGFRLPSMQQLESLTFESGAFHILPWYGGGRALRQLVTGTAVWDVDGYPPLPLRWVLVIDPTGKQPPTALFSTSFLLSARDIVELYVARWSLEVTFEETRAHLGVQSQRQWAKAATTRTTPVLLGLFSLTCLMSIRLHARSPLVPRSAAWYAKPEVTFSDLLEAVRTSLWRARLVPRPALHLAPVLSLNEEREQLIQLLASTF